MLNYTKLYIIIEKDNKEDHANYSIHHRGGYEFGFDRSGRHALRLREVDGSPNHCPESKHLSVFLK